ncbi:MAG: UDP-N-acetylmuramoyl-L-alanine--D-glutamate ligase [bacterium]|nr:UDP-N-acetylmuramoyl-L-alanine--D-glutamate ligase [bacterium]
MIIEELTDKKILILGFAREGRDTLKFLQQHFPSKVFGIADEKESLANLPKKKVKLFLGKKYLRAIRQYDVVVKSPGIPLKMVQPLLKKSQSLTSETDIFFSLCQGTIIGVTGTKGKSTTSSLIYSVLKEGGKKVQLVGNIGKPALQFLARQTTEDIFVFELSSFQLEHLGQSPHIAVLLNLYQEHLNHHGTFSAYAKAKANITAHQSESDFLIFNKDDKEVLKIAKKSKAQKIPFIKKSVSPFLAPIEPALLIGKLFSIPQSNIQKAIKDFQPLPHRLENVGTYKGITFINDSLATIPEATIGALDALGKNVSTLIAGGYDRGISMTQLARRIEKSSITTLILFPDTGKNILNALRNRGNFLARGRLKRHRSQRNYPPNAKQLAFGPKNIFFTDNMKEAVKLAYLHTKRRGSCLLSPAASSFNLFHDYKDRGDQFKKAAKQYARY